MKNAFRRVAARTGVEPVYQPETAYAFPRVRFAVATLPLLSGRHQAQ